MGIDTQIREDIILRYPRVVSRSPIDLTDNNGRQWVYIEASVRFCRLRDCPCRTCSRVFTH